MHSAKQDETRRFRGFQVCIALPAALIAGNCLVIGTAFLIKFATTRYPEDWTRADFEKYIGAEIPDTATNVYYDADGGRDLAVIIRFEVLLNEADAFAQQFCDGELRQGFNPFGGYNYQAGEHEFGLYCAPPETSLLVDRRNGTTDQVTLIISEP